MRRKVLWIAAALVLIATPAVIGLVALRGDESSSQARRPAALVPEGAKSGAGYQMKVTGVTPTGQAIGVLSFSWGVKNPGSALSAGTATGKAQFKELTITKTLDQASPLLVKAAVAGTQHDSVLTLFKNVGGVVTPYATYTLTNAMIVSVDHSGNADDIPMEQVSFAYSALKVESADASAGAEGKLSPTNQFSYDLATAG
jgi:type VI secretion system secreted protein Hcp